MLKLIQMCGLVAGFVTRNLLGMDSYLSTWSLTVARNRSTALFVRLGLYVVPTFCIISSGTKGRLITYVISVGRDFCAVMASRNISIFMRTVRLQNVKSVTKSTKATWCNICALTWRRSRMHALIVTCGLCRGLSWQSMNVCTVGSGHTDVKCATWPSLIRQLLKCTFGATQVKSLSSAWFALIERSISFRIWRNICSRFTRQTNRTCVRVACLFSKQKIYLLNTKVTASIPMERRKRTQSTPHLCL